MATHSPYHNPLFPSHAFPDPDDTPIPDDGDIDDEDNIFRDMTFDEIMEDLNARFLINLPKEEMNLLRVYWQAEQAHWFYEDYLRPLNPLLPSLSQRHFTRLIIESSPLYKRLVSSDSIDHDSVWDEYRSYKRMVPCCGGIMLNKQGDKVVLVRGWKSNSGWSFPRGKINLNETLEACAVREVEEETGYDLTGMVKSEDRIQTHINAQEVTMFIVGGIDEGTVFETQTRHEIGAIEWVSLSDLPTWSGNKKTKKNTNKRFYNVTPFVNPLKAWMKANGLNPHPKPRPKKPPFSQPSASPGNFHRDIKPFRFDAFSGSPSASPQLHTPSPAPSHFPSRGSSALDQLFSKFIHKQEEEILAPRQGDAVGSDNNAGLERLFGGLDVLKEEEQAMLERQKRSDGYSQEDARRFQKEDDDLVRLLAGVGTPAPDLAKLLPRNQQSQRQAAQQQPQVQHQQQPQPKATQNHLLAMLNQKSIGATPVPAGHGSLPQAQPHQSKLLHLISQPAHSPTQSPRASVSPSYHTAQSRPGSHPSVGAEGTEEDRAARARALLEISFAGLGLGEGSSASSHTAGSPQPAQSNQTRGQPRASGQASAPVHNRAPATQPAAQSQASLHPQVPAHQGSGPGNSPRSQNPPPSYDSVLRDNFPSQCQQAAAHAPAPGLPQVQTFERAPPPHMQQQVVPSGYVQQQPIPNPSHVFQPPLQAQAQSLPSHVHISQHHAVHPQPVPMPPQQFRPPPQAVPLGVAMQQQNMNHPQQQGQGYRPVQGQMPPGMGAAPPGLGPGPGPGYAPPGVGYYPAMPPPQQQQQQQQHFAPPPPHAQAPAQGQGQGQGYYPAQAPVVLPADGGAPGQQGMYRQGSGNVQPVYGYGHGQNPFPGGVVPQALPAQQHQQQQPQVSSQSLNKVPMNGGGNGMLPGMQQQQQGQQGQGGAVHHPVPRQPGNAGLLAMLNGGR
ncbi:hypothetical protein I350_08286 [Cryptococcus amylolentus CBS 6273]|uniref:Nudix hydrolase domain-containing protein n=1 Tax=Cryptococcus amylolentus CBS 6273 TaxID=1296118 RepID=A0A1E3J6I2_9TREE|nr:hypothetical protein I350_08286 [Cryptococcus amylolentus CBS 6273]